MGHWVTSGSSAWCSGRLLGLRRTAVYAMIDYPLLSDMMVHHMDMVRYVTGHDFAWVRADAFQPKWSWFNGHAGVTITGEMTNGAVFTQSEPGAATAGTRHGMATGTSRGRRGYNRGIRTSSNCICRPTARAGIRSARMSRWLQVMNRAGVDFARV